MRTLLKPSFWIPAIAAFLIGTVANAFQEYVTESGGILLVIIAVLAIIFGLISVWWSNRFVETKVSIESIPLHNAASRLIHARTGLIVFVSLFKPNEDNTHYAQLENLDARLAAADEQDFSALDLPNSNLATVITTINAHASKLNHCWLVATTTNEPATSSVTYAPALVAYLKQKVGIDVTFHYGDEYSVRIDHDDALITNQTRILVNKIYEDAHKLGIKENAIAADFSGGIRSMTLGMILACLNRGRSIQFAGTRYDADSKPTGEIFPILFNFEAELEQSG